MRIRGLVLTLVAGMAVARADRVPAEQAAVRAFATGEHFTCALLISAEVRCWGWNHLGRAGLGAREQSSLPLPIGISDGQSLAAGRSHGCAARADGSVWCWGNNGDGQVGDGTTEERRGPVRVAGLSGVVQVVAGGHHSCARDDQGAVWCWGHPGCVGHGKDQPHERPGRVAELHGARHLVAGDDVTCAFVDGGPPRCWGFNSTALLGQTLGPSERAVPAPVLEKATTLALGFRHTCFAGEGGWVFCGGNDEKGQLGDQRVPDEAFCHTHSSPDGGIVECSWRDPLPRETSDSRLLRERRPPPPSPREQKKSYPSRSYWPNTGLHDVRALAGGDGRSCAITADGGVSCWGQSYSGATDWSHRIAAPIPGLQEVIAIGVSHEHGCALRADHTLRCFGYNRFGELGTGTRTENLEKIGATLVKWK